MPRFTPLQLRKFSKAIFEAMNVPSVEAGTVAEVLVEANLKGHDSHGVRMIITYVQRIKDGSFNVPSKISIVRETPSIALIDGHQSLGAVVAKKAMEIAIEKAKKCDISYVGVMHCAHIGRLGYYANMASKHDMIGIVSVDAGGTTVTPYPGRACIMGTNPICVAIPTKNEVPFTLDMATSVVAAGKISAKFARHEKLPEGWIIDSDGNPSTDPKIYEERKKYTPYKAMLLNLGEPIVGYKGHGLALAVDILTGILTGEGRSTAHLPSRVVGNNSIFIVCLNIASVTSVDRFKSDVDDLYKAVKNIPLRPGFEEIIMPGERSTRTEKTRVKEGIDIPDDDWKALSSIAQELKLDVQKIIR